MAVSDAQKKASAKYHREHIASVACRVTKEQGEAFKQFCESQGKTCNSVLREYVLQCIGENTEEQEEP